MCIPERIILIYGPYTAACIFIKILSLGPVFNTINTKIDTLTQIYEGLHSLCAP